MKRLFRLLMLVAVVASVFRASISLAGAVSSTASGGDWNVNSTWVGNKVPGTGDDVTIVAGASVTVTAVDFCHSITFGNNSASTATLTVNAGVTLALGTGITAQNSAMTNTSALIQGAGTLTCGPLTVGGTMNPTLTGSDFTSTLTTTISNLNVSGPLTVKALYNPPQSAANQGVFALSSGTVTAPNISFATVPFFGPTLTLATGNQNGTLALSNSAPFNFAGGGSSTFTPNGSNATVIYGGANQTVNAAIYQNLTFAGSGVKSNSGVTVNGILSMQGSAKASATPVYGPNAVLQYNGTTAQTNSAELASILPNLTVNNSNVVFITNSTTVTKVLNIVLGAFLTGTNRLIIETNGAISGASSSNGWVIGNLQKNFSAGTQSFLFPLGDTEYAPLNLSNLSVTATGAVIASTTPGAPPQIASSGINTNQDVNRYWTITNSSGTFGSYAATFFYPAADLDAGSVASQFAVSSWNGSTWSFATVGGTPTTNLTSISGHSGFGNFIIGDPVATNLAITSVNGGVPPQVGTGFSVVVQTQDLGGNPCNVSLNTRIALSLVAGNGSLGGTLTGTIPAGTNSVTITGVTYSLVQSGVQIAAASTSGVTLATGISAPFTVSAENQTITFPSPGNQTYGVAPITLTGTATSGLPVAYSITSGPATVSNTLLTITGAGSVTIQASQSGNANWNAATPVSQTISIAAKTVIGGITANNKIYDGTTVSTVASTSLSGVINSDVVSLTVGSAAFSDKNVGNGKTVVASGLGLSGTNAGNYVLASNSATNTANITAATLTVTANNTNRNYGVTNPVFTVSYSGFVSGDDTSVLTGAPSLTTTAITNSPVPGSPYSITVTQGTLSAANYSFTFVSGNLTVTPATLTVTANNQSRPYGATDPLLTASYGGFVNGEDTNVLNGSPSLSTAAISNSPPGTYPIQVAAGTLSATNYSFSFDNGTLTVSSLPVMLTIQSSVGATNMVVLGAVGLTPNSTYQILASTDLVNWSEIASAQVAGDGTLSFTNPAVSSVQFYRTLGP